MTRIMFETDISNIWGSIEFSDLMKMEDRLSQAHNTLAQGTGEGNDFLGWYHLPSHTTEDELDEIQKAANRIRRDSKALVVIGIGGSYLGARAAIEFMNGVMHNETDPVKIYFAGNHLSTRALNALVARLENVDFSINIVSKSGSTMETAVAARMFRWMLNRKYGPDEAKKRIYVTTDPMKGKLRALAKEEGYTTFPIPSNVGGRYSVFTACGLLPMAVAGIDIRSVMAGARQAETELNVRSMENPAWLYAAARNLMYENGKKIEMLCSYEPDFEYVGRWWQQLFGESEGKDGKGIFPACARSSTTDLHSMGQMLQQGPATPSLRPLVRFDRRRSTHLAHRDRLARTSMTSTTWPGKTVELCGGACMPGRGHGSCGRRRSGDCSEVRPHECPHSGLSHVLLPVVLRHQRLCAGGQSL